MTITVSGLSAKAYCQAGQIKVHENVTVSGKFGGVVRNDGAQAVSGSLKTVVKDGDGHSRNSDTPFQVKGGGEFRIDMQTPLLVSYDKAGSKEVNTSITVVCGKSYVSDDKCTIKVV